MEIHIIMAFLVAFIAFIAWFVTNLECDYMEAKQQLRQLEKQKTK